MENTENTEQVASHQNEKEEAVMKIYEIGYHIVPAVAEEQLPAEVGNLKGLIESKGGLFISEEFPKLRPLAYAIPKVVDGRKQNFTEAYFGWVKFEATPEAIGGINSSFQSNPHILRHLLIETVRENTMSFVRPATFKKDEEGTVDAPAAPREEITKEDEERISKSIDELVVG